jgi:PHD/YefM family antitoxin component YafN of YafNO toxin-antitoxin module
MAITTLSSREFNHDTGRAKRAAQRGPVFITDRGRPSLVLMSIEDYNKLQPMHGSIVDLLSTPQAADIEFEPVTLRAPLVKVANLS